MLAPYTERVEDEALLDLCAASLALYPAFARRIEAASGVSVHLRLDGIVNAAFDDERMQALRDHAAHLRERNVACAVLDRSETMVAEPSLGRHVRGALVVVGEGCVDNRRLGRALTAACESAGVAIVRNARDVAIESDARRVLGVRSDLGFAPAAHVVVATGAWSASVPGLPPSCAPPIEPIKGQMLALGTPRGFLRRTTWLPRAYLVPRDDGRLLIGATVERAGFDERVTADGMRSLLVAALEAAPSLGAFSLTETWAGLRPGTPDERPILGPVPRDGLVLATGHYRNGILLTPVTALLVADFIETGNASSLAPWLLARFEKEGAGPKRMSKP
jgi:glycine oxidase